MSSKPNRDKMHFFIDLDGTCLVHPDDIPDGEIQEFIPGVVEKLKMWLKQGHQITFVTARDESKSSQTLLQLNSAGIYFCNVIFNCGHGQRIMINDSKPYHFWKDKETALAFTVKRNEGLSELDFNM